MVLLCKQKALYVKACVIPNGITDSQGDTLFAEDIKKIFTSFNNQDNFEVYHNDIPIKEVSLLENYISVADETIGTSIVPRGSWMCVIRVDNPEIQEGLLTGEFGGISLNNRIAPRCQGNLTGQVKYSDIADAECVIPLLISFVKRAANGYGLHVYDYEAYIKKSNTSNKGANKMAFDLLGGLKSLIEKAEASKDEDAVILKEDTEATKEDEEVEATAEEAPTEEPVVKKEDATEEVEDESEEEAVIEKEDDETAVEAEEESEETEIIKDDAEVSLEERVAKLEEIIAELTKEDEEVDEESEETTSEETEEEAEEVVDEDTPKITKSEKVIVTDEKTVPQTNYYEMTNRDPITGKKIRN